MEKTLRLLSLLKQEILSETYKSNYRTEARYFTRNRLFTFPSMILLSLNMLSRSLSVEISKFLSKFHFSGLEQDGSKQAFSKARNHIRWEAFVHLNDLFIGHYYSDQAYLHYQGKYLVLATDGSNYELPYEPSLIETFGVHDNGCGQATCMAQGLKLYDVLNDLTVLSEFAPYNSSEAKGCSEKRLFEAALKKLPQLISAQEHEVIILGDKYYPSFYNLYQLPQAGYHFIFRTRANFCKEVQAFSQSGQIEANLVIDLKQYGRQYIEGVKRIGKHVDQLYVRCVKLPLGQGEYTFLLTDLSAQVLSYEDIQALYQLRWKEETSYDTDKNKLEVENLSSKTPNGVRQDFHAKMLVGNIAQLLIKDAQEELELQQKKKNNKHSYKINRAYTIGIIKNELPKLFFEIQEPHIWYGRMIKKIIRRKEPIRPNRRRKRERKHKLKFHINKRRVI